MKQNRKNCAAIYTEEEYEQLVLEAYWQARDTVKMANNRYRFNCIYCRESHKDKNTVSYHRMFNLCRAYNGEKPLKMYPTWEPSNHGEKHRIALKYGKQSSPHGSHSHSPSTFPPPLDLDAGPLNSPVLESVTAEHGNTSRKRKLQTRSAVPPVAGRTRNIAPDHPPAEPPRRNLATKAAPKPPRSPSETRRRRPKPKPKPAPPRIAIISSSEEELSSNSSPSESNSTSKGATPGSQNTGDGQFRVVKHETVLQSPNSPRNEVPDPPQQAEPEIIRASILHHGVVLDDPSAEPVPQPVHVQDIVVQPETPKEDALEVFHAQPSTAPIQPLSLSREDCKQKAYEEATALFMSQSVSTQPPEPVPVDGLYVLITETDEQWVPMRLLDEPDACMQFLHRQLEDGTIRQNMGNAFGQWYLYGNKKVIHYHSLSFSSVLVYIDHLMFAEVLCQYIV